MLKNLTIYNYALIDEMSIDFQPGMNILTGETGAGKSIIIGALSLLLGERATTDVIRKGASKAVVEGMFDVPKTSYWEALETQIEVGDGSLFLRREVHPQGRSRAFVNDSPVSIALLSQIGDLLIDLHGQHAHQSLLNTERHLDYLDNFCIPGDLLERTHASYKRFKDLQEVLTTLRERERILEEKLELLAFQVQ